MFAPRLTFLEAVGGGLMVSGYRPQWLRLPEALDLLKGRGLTLADARAALTRAIQDRLYPRSLGGMFRLPDWRHSPRFRGRSWVTAPKIDWAESKIAAPCWIRSVLVLSPTLLEVSADLLTHISKDTSAKVAASHRGRPDRYDWDEGFQYMHKLLGDRGDPLKKENAELGWRSDADIGRAVSAHIAEPNGQEPDHKHVMRRIRSELSKWRRGA